MTRQTLARVAAGLAACALALPLAAKPADAHSVHPMALWTCAANRNGAGGEEATVVDAHNLTMGNGWVAATCFTEAEQLNCNYANRSYSNGVTVHVTGPNCWIG